MSETVTYPESQFTASEIIYPGFGETPQPFTAPPTYPELLGPLYNKLVEQYKDGIDVINTIPNPGLSPKGARLLYEELVILEGCDDPDSFNNFLKQVTHSPVYENNGIRADSLPEYSELYLRKAVSPPATQIGAQRATIKTGKMITTGPNRFSPSTPKELRHIEHDNGDKEVVQLGSIFYWDSEPSIEELLALGEHPDVIDVLDTYADMTEQYGGNILNWNNTSANRSQLPMFFRMVEQAAEHLGDEVLVRYLRPMILHYNFWRDGMNDPEKLRSEAGATYRRTARLIDGEAALRNFDDLHDHSKPDNPLTKCCPRPEMHKHDVNELAAYERRIGRELSPEKKCDFFQGYFAGAESGLDFTQDQRDLEDGRLIGHHLINPALNAMYAQGGLTIARAWRALAEQDPSMTNKAEQEAQLYEQETIRIKQILFKYCYNESDKMFGMYDFVKGATNIDAGRRPARSLNGLFVLTSILSPDIGHEKQIANEVLDGVDREYLRPGGLLAASRYFESNDQWDGKASWPILVREAVKAAVRFGRLDLAKKWLTIHIESDELLFKATGRLAEKNDSSTRGKALIIGEYGKVNDLTMTHAVHSWMRRTLKWIRRHGVANAASSATVPTLLE